MDNMFDGNQQKTSVATRYSIKKWNKIPEDDRLLGQNSFKK